jgi:hypothetical protein
MSVWKSFRDGIIAATRIPAPLVVMFGVSLVIALALTVPATAAMNTWIGRRLTARDLARDFNGLTLLEPLISASAVLQSDTAPSTDAMASSRTAATVLITLMITALAAALIAPLPGIALGGGVLLTYVEGRFAWRRFLWGAWHWLLAFFMLAIFFGLCVTLVVTLGLMALAVVQAIQSPALTTLTLVLVAVVYAVLAMTFEYARVIAVAEGTRNFFQALGRAAVLVARRPAQTFGLYALMSAFGLALIPLYADVAAPIIPFEWAVAAIAAQQFFILSRLWTRLARWASEAALYGQLKEG